MAGCAIRGKSLLAAPRQDAKDRLSGRRKFNRSLCCWDGDSERGMSKMLELFVLHLLNESHCELFEGRCLHIPVEEILKDLDLKTVYLNKNIPASVYLKVLQQTVPKHSRVHKFTIPISASCNSHITGRIMGHKMFFVARAPPTMRDEGEREKNCSLAGEPRATIQAL